MNTTRTLIGGLLLVFALLSGLWLSRLGTPCHGPMFAVHKLVALGTVIFLGNMIYRLHQNAYLSVPGSIGIVVSGLLVLSLFISGALLSAGSPAGLALLVHRVAPSLATVFAASTIYLLSASTAR